MSPQATGRRKFEHSLDLAFLMQYLFSACAIQPDLHVIRSCSKVKITQFFGTGTGYEKVKKNRQFFTPKYNTKEIATEFMTLFDYVIPRNKVMCFLRFQ